MKKILSGLSVALFLISCNNPASNTNADNTSANSNIATNNKIYKAIETGNVSSIDSIIATDAVDHDAPNSTELKGRDSIVKALGDVHNHIKDLKLDVISNAASGDYVFTLLHVTGTVTDSSMGMAGKSIDEKGVDVVKFKDNKISDHWGFTEDSDARKAMMEMENKDDKGKMKM